MLQHMTIPPEIKDPCPLQWDTLSGDNRMRFCQQCQFQVQNLSSMSTRDIKRVLSRCSSERVCLAYLRNQDGSLATRGALFRERMATPLRRLFAWMVTAFVPIALGACGTHPKSRTVVMGYVVADRNVHKEVVSDTHKPE
jgi:hypothetical protein